MPPDRGPPREFARAAAAWSGLPASVSSKSEDAGDFPIERAVELIEQDRRGAERRGALQQVGRAAPDAARDVGPSPASTHPRADELLDHPPHDAHARRGSGPRRCPSTGDCEDHLIAAERAEPEAMQLGLGRKRLARGSEEFACKLPRPRPGHLDRRDGPGAGRREHPHAGHGSASAAMRMPSRVRVGTKRVPLNRFPKCESPEVARRPAGDEHPGG